MSTRNDKPTSAQDGVNEPQRHGDEYARKLPALRAALQEGIDAIARGKYDDIDVAHLDAYLYRLGKRPARPKA